MFFEVVGDSRDLVLSLRNVQCVQKECRCSVFGRFKARQIQLMLDRGFEARHWFVCSEAMCSLNLSCGTWKG